MTFTVSSYLISFSSYRTLYILSCDVTSMSCSAFFNYISGGAIAPPGKEFAPPVKPFLPPKCEAELLMIAVRIAVDLLDNEIIPFHSILHSHLVCNSYCSSPSIS